jgi:hypothetical protein
VNEDRKRLLLGIAAALAVARFGIVPWLDSQAEARETLEIVTKRLDRSEGVADNRDAIVAAREALAKQAEPLRARFPMAATPDEFRLVAQQSIGRLARASNVEMRVFDWIVEGRVEAAQLRYGRARITLQGALRDVVRAHGELEGALGNAAIRELQVQMRRPASGPGEGVAEATLVVDLYYRQGTT